MLSTLNHISLVWNRLCKNRASFHFALRRLTKHDLRGPLPAYIETAAVTNNALINQLDVILDHMGRPGGPLSP